MTWPSAEGARRWLDECAEPFLLIDAGGVLFNNVTEDSTFIADAAACLDLDPATMLAAYTSGEGEFEVGRRPVREVIDRGLRARGRLPMGDARWPVVERLYLEAVRPNRPLLRLLAEYDGPATLVLANNEAEHWDRLKDRAFGHWGPFSRLACSWRLGACKPTVEYFDAVGRLLEPAPAHRWHLLDDHPEVVAAARRYGLRATLSTTLSSTTLSTALSTTRSGPPSSER